MYEVFNYIKSISLSSYVANYRNIFTLIHILDFKLIICVRGTKHFMSRGSRFSGSSLVVRIFSLLMESSTSYSSIIFK